MSCSMRESAVLAETAAGIRKYESGDQETDRDGAASRIAIIDQGVLVRDLFKRGLELASGFEIITASTVEDWLNDANGTPVKLIIICLREGQSVHEVRDKIHALSIRQDCPVAILADKELIDTESVTWLLEQGAHGLISTNMPVEAAVHVLRMVSAAER